jgi:hypothetical protein
MNKNSNTQNTESYKRTFSNVDQLLEMRYEDDLWMNDYTFDFTVTSFKELSKLVNFV